MSRIQKLHERTILEMKNLTNSKLYLLFEHIALNQLSSLITKSISVSHSKNKNNFE